MRPRRYLACTTAVLLLAGFLPVLSLQEQTADKSSTSPSTAEASAKPDDDTTAPTSNTTAEPTGTDKAASTTQTPSSTKKPTIKPPVVNCLADCICPSERELICEDLELSQLPKLEAKSTFVRASFARNNIEVLDLSKLRAADKLEHLDLSDNKIKSIVLQPKKSSVVLQLTRLNLSDNALESLSALNSWSMPNLEQLDVSRNKISQLSLGPADSRPKLTRLIATNLRLTDIDSQALVAAPRLTFLNLSRVQSDSGDFLANSVFAKNTKLDTLDLSGNALIEVPTALRYANSLKRLTLNDNFMTSLRPADFVNLTNLEYLELRRCGALRRVDANAFGALDKLNTLVISSNFRLSDFSPEAFTPIKLRIAPQEATRLLKLVDLSGNNLTTLAKIDLDCVTIEQLRLADNPLDCSCWLEWLVKMPNLSQQQPIHCMTPRKYRDLELSQFFEVHDCTEKDSMLQRCVVTLCILFLVLVTIAVFVQKTDLCRRLRWRDQYGTIYYTKASFPQEATLS